MQRALNDTSAIQRDLLIQQEQFMQQNEVLTTSKKSIHIIPQRTTHTADGNNRLYRAIV